MAVKMIIFRWKKKDIFLIFLLKTQIMGTRRNGLTELVLTFYTHNICFKAKLRKNVYPCKPQFYYKSGVWGGINYTGVLSWCLEITWMGVCAIGYNYHFKRKGYMYFFSKYPMSLFCFNSQRKQFINCCFFIYYWTFSQVKRLIANKLTLMIYNLHPMMCVLFSLIWLPTGSSPKSLFVNY